MQGQYFSQRYALVYAGAFANDLPDALPHELRVVEFHLADAEPPAADAAADERDPWAAAPPPPSLATLGSGDALPAMRVAVVSRNGMGLEGESGRWLLVSLALDAAVPPDPALKGKGPVGAGNTNTEPVAYELVDTVGALGSADGPTAASQKAQKYPPDYVVPRKVVCGQAMVEGLMLPKTLPEGNYTISIRDGSGCPFLAEGSDMPPLLVKFTCVRGWKWVNGKACDPDDMPVVAGKKK